MLKSLYLLIIKDGSFFLKKLYMIFIFRICIRKKNIDLFIGVFDEKGKVVCYWRMVNVYKCVFFVGYYKN